MIDAHRPFALLVLTTIAWAAQPLRATAQPQVSATASAVVQSQEIDLSHYYPSRGAALHELDGLRLDAAALPKAAAARQAGLSLQRADRLIGRARRLSAYFSLLAARDIDDHGARSASDRTDAVRDMITGKVDAMLLRLPASAIKGPRSPLRRYGYLASLSAEHVRHTISPDASRVLDVTSASAMATYWALYQKTARLPVVTKDKAPQPGGPDRAAREAAWRARWVTSDAKADINATILLAIAQLGEQRAKLSHYPDAASAGYAGRGLNRAMVDRMLAAVRSNLALYRAYDQHRAAQLMSLSSIADPRPWDLALLSGGLTPHFTLDDARRIARAALAPLGAGYVRHFTALLAPGAGRLDVAATPGNREQGGFSVNAPGVPSGLYMASFDGSPNSLRVVFHEGGHAIAGQFVSEAGTSSFFADGPNWLSESYAILNQMLLYDYLAHNSTSPAERHYYARLLVDDMMFQLFGSAEEATLEQAIHDGVAIGKITSAADLNDCTLRVMKDFEPWPDDVLRTSSTLWSTKRLMFQDPFYLVNYLYAGIVAINLYKQAQEHPDTFPARYGALLRRGYDAPPMTLLAPLLGKDASADSLAEAAFAVMRTKLDALPPMEATGSK